MIYLIESAGYDPIGGFENQLKIGYTSDGSSRFNAYLTHNPTCIVLYKIPLWSDTLEKKIHKYFSYIRHPGGKEEWYKHSDSILEFFAKFKDSKEEEVEKYIDEILKIRSFGYSLEGDLTYVEFFKNYWFYKKTKRERLEFVYSNLDSLRDEELDNMESDVCFYVTRVKSDIAKELDHDIEKVRKIAIECSDIKERLLSFFEQNEIYSREKIEKILKIRIYPFLNLTVEDIENIVKFNEIDIDGEVYFKCLINKN